MVNLIVTGKATSNTFDNIMEIDTGGAKKVTFVTSLIRFGYESCSTLISIEKNLFFGGGRETVQGEWGGCVTLVNTRMHHFSFSLHGAQFHSSVIEDCNCKINFCLFLNSPFKLFLFLRMYLKE